MKIVGFVPQKTCLCSALTLLVAGCTTPQEYRLTRAQAKAGPLINVEQATEWSKEQSAFLRAFNGGVDPKSDGAAEWTAITRNGLNFVDTRCNLFFSHLDDYTDEQRNLRDSTGLVGTASTTLLALANAATAAIAAVGGAFTLTQGLMDSGAQTILFPIPPTRLQTLHAKAADAYRAARLGDPSKNPISSRAHAAEVIGGYAQLCTPVALKGLVGDTLDQVRFGARPGDGRVVVEGFSGAEAKNLVTPGTIFGTDKPAASGDPAATERPRNPDLSRSRFERVFSGPGWTGTELRTLQAAFCIPASERGTIGPKTIANVNMLVTESELNPGADGPRIGDPDYGRVVSVTGGACDTTRHRNYYENTEFLDASVEQARLADMKALFSGETESPPASFAEPGARSLIGRARVKCGLPNDARHPFVDQATPDLMTKLANNACGA